MFFKRKSPQADQLYALYNAIVAQSRQAVFYAEWGVPDTLTGRFDAISLHLALFIDRLSTGLDADQGFAQNLLDLFFKDMDRSLREMGVGDISVPKRVGKMGEMFYGLAKALGQALGQGPDPEDTRALHRALARNIVPDAQLSQVEMLADYVAQLHRRLKDADLAAVKAGQPLQAQTSGEMEANERGNGK